MVQQFDSSRSGAFLNMSTSKPKTPWPSDCPICGETIVAGALQVPGEVSCPECGHVLWFHVRTVEGVVVLDVISGKVAINQELDKVCGMLTRDREKPCVVLNMSGVQFVSSSFIAGLVALHKRLRSLDGKMVVCEMNPVVQETLHGAKLDKLLFITANEHEALNAF
jgi:anti-anti-sigma factor